MTRRNFIRNTMAGIVSSFLPINIFYSCSPSLKKPNVLFIIADDMNDYGFYQAYPGVKMPYLEKFKKTALTFEKAYCAAPACVPSRAAVFSGMFPHKTGSYLNGSDPWNNLPFTEIEAMPECFKRNGYTTFGRGKLFHSQPPEERRSAMWDNEVWGGGFGPFPSEENQIQGRFWGVQSFPEEEFPDVKNAEAAIEFLKQDHQKPFFMVYGLWRPHTPFTAPQKFYDMYDPEDLLIPIPGWKKDDLDDVPSWGIQLAKVWGDRFDLCGNKDPQAWRKFVLAYCACTTFADWSAGRVIETLENSQYSENTVVIFWSDNGYHCGEKNHWEKTTLWEQASLTPMAIRIPGMKTAGSTNKTPVNSLDFYPTLVDYCQLNSPPQELDGQTLRPLLEHPEKMMERVSITTYGEGFFSVRNNRYRYIQYPDGSEELYDFERDPHEFNNLANVPELKLVKESLLKSKPIKWKKSLGGKFG